MKKNETENTEIKEERKPVKAAGTYTYEKTERKRIEEPSGNALPFRLLAILCWLIALLCETAAVLFFIGKPEAFADKGVWTVIAALLLDLVFVVLGSTFWKKGNRLNPPSEKKKNAFFLANNLGLFAASLAFWPFVLIALSDRRAAGKTKAVSAALALIAIAGEVAACLLK